MLNSFSKIHEKKWCHFTYKLVVKVVLKYHDKCLCFIFIKGLPVVVLINK